MALAVGHWAQVLRVAQVLDAMDYAVYVHDVEHIVLDNLQFILSGQVRRTYKPRLLPGLL